MLRPLTVSFGNFARTFRVVERPRKIPSAIIVTRQIRLKRLRYCCSAGKGSTTERRTMRASGMNRPMMCGRESTTSRM